MPRGRAGQYFSQSKVHTRAKGELAHFLDRAPLHTDTQELEARLLQHQRASSSTNLLTTTSQARTGAQTVQSSSWSRLEKSHEHHRLEARKGLCSTGKIKYLVSPLVHVTSPSDSVRDAQTSHQDEGCPTQPPHPHLTSTPSSRGQHQGEWQEEQARVFLSRLPDLGAQDILGHALTYPDALPETRADAKFVLESLAGAGLRF